MKTVRSAGHDPHRRLRISFTVVTTAACVVLIPWTITLAITLPRHYVASHWRLAWVGLDAALSVFLARTAWLTYRRRRGPLVVSAVVTGTLLCVDAWFDVVTATGSSDRLISLATAVFGSIPLAILLFVAAHRVLWAEPRPESLRSDEADRVAGR